MNTNIKAIETHYDGYRFRSRLEARWAVFLNSLKEPYEYEKEGYSLPSGNYLPDFWLPRMDCWMEIKGEKPTEYEIQLCEELALATDKPIVIVHGLPVVPDTYETTWSMQIFCGYARRPIETIPEETGTVRFTTRRWCYFAHRYDGDVRLHVLFGEPEWWQYYAYPQSFRMYPLFNFSMGDATHISQKHVNAAKSARFENFN
jgi:hypothetical protein